MSAEIFASLFGFFLAAGITPGPNNFMLFASGVNFGFRRTIPHILGITMGFMILLGAIGLGLGEIINRFPPVFLAIKVCGGLYMVYLAWRIATSGPAGKQKAQSRPLTFFQAALFQWVNPKAWVIAVVATATFTSTQSYYLTLAIVIATAGFITVPITFSWTAFGNLIQRALSNPKHLRAFNIAMALALIASLWPMLT